MSAILPEGVYYRAESPFSIKPVGMARTSGVESVNLAQPVKFRHLTSVAQT